MTTRTQLQLLASEIFSDAAVLDAKLCNATVGATSEQVAKIDEAAHKLNEALTAIAHLMHPDDCIRWIFA